jgi:integrase
MDMILTNPADKVERPKKNHFTGSFYKDQELNQLFEAVKGDPIELAVLLAAFYGLRRSEIVGLKWQAINFQKQTLSIQHTVIPVSYGGKQITIAKDRAKNKSSHRTLPLVPVFQDLLSHYSTTANIYAHLDYSSKISSAQVMSNTLQIPMMQKAPEPS